MRSPLAPVLFREALRATRRRSTYAMRVAFAAVPAFALMPWLVPGTHLETASAGRDMYLALAYVLLGGVTILSPSLGGGALLEERDQGTFDLLRLTGIDTWSVFTGKVLSRVIDVGLAVLAMAPILAFTVTFGGVDPYSVAGTISFTLALGLLLAVTGAAFALHGRSPATTTLGLLFVSQWCAPVGSVSLGMMASQSNIDPSVLAMSGEPLVAPLIEGPWALIAFAPLLPAVLVALRHGAQVLDLVTLDRRATPLDGAELSLALWAYERDGRRLMWTLVSGPPLTAGLLVLLPAGSARMLAMSVGWSLLRAALLAVVLRMSFRRALHGEATALRAAADAASRPVHPMPWGGVAWYFGRRKWRPGPTVHLSASVVYAAALMVWFGYLTAAVDAPALLVLCGLGAIVGLIYTLGATADSVRRHCEGGGAVLLALGPRGPTHLLDGTCAGVLRHAALPGALCALGVRQGLLDNENGDLLALVLAVPHGLVLVWLAAALGCAIGAIAPTRQTNAAICAMTVMALIWAEALVIDEYEIGPLTGLAEDPGGALVAMSTLLALLLALVARGVGVVLLKRQVAR